MSKIIFIASIAVALSTVFLAGCACAQTMPEHQVETAYLVPEPVVPTVNNCDVTQFVETCKDAPFSRYQKIKDPKVFFKEADNSRCFDPSDLISYEKMNEYCKLKNKIEQGSF